MPRIPTRIKAAIANRMTLAGAIKSMEKDRKDEDSQVTGWLVTNAELLGEVVQGKQLVSVTVQTDPETMVTATLVQPSSQELDEEELQRRIGTKVWNTLVKTVTVLDTDKLQEALNTGRISTEDIKACLSEVRGTPYTKFTASKIKKGK